MPIVTAERTKSVFGWVLVCQPRHTLNVIGFINTISSRNRWLQVFQAYRPKIKHPGYVNNIIVSTWYVQRSIVNVRSFLSGLFFFVLNILWYNGWGRCSTVLVALAQPSGRWVILYIINTPTSEKQVHLHFLPTHYFSFRFNHFAAFTINPFLSANIINNLNCY